MLSQVLEAIKALEEGVLEDIREGDVIEAFREVEVKKTLK